MRYLKPIPIGIGMMISLTLLVNGCGMLTVGKKPDIGPAGTPVEAKANPPFTQRFLSPPIELYDLEATSGIIFEAIVKNNWSQAEAGLVTLRKIWLQVKNPIGDKKGVAEADETLESLSTAIHDHNTMDSYENLIKFMSSIGEIGKSYKLSPLSDIISVGNSIRTVSFYATNKNWPKAVNKMKELDSTWGQGKPSMESIGIFSKITTTHSIIKQLKDGIDAENEGAVKEHIKALNESMGYIRDYYRNQ